MTTMIFRWNSVVTRHEVEVTDVTIRILDKDNETHKIYLKGKWSWDDEGNMYAHDTVYTADRLLDREEYLLTYAGLRIPRCNIKNCKFDTTTRIESANYTNLGIKDWGLFEWFCFVVVVCFFLGILTLFVLCIVDGVIFK